MDISKLNKSECACAGKCFGQESPNLNINSIPFWNLTIDHPVLIRVVNFFLTGKVNFSNSQFM